MRSVRLTPFYVLFSFDDITIQNRWVYQRCVLKARRKKLARTGLSSIVYELKQKDFVDDLVVSSVSNAHIIRGDCYT